MEKDNNEFIKHYNTIEKVLETAKKANNHRISEFNVNHRNLSKNAKGSIGQIIEEGLFGYEINSDSSPDFRHLNLELKVTGLKKVKNNQLK